MTHTCPSREIQHYRICCSILFGVLVLLIRVFQSRAIWSRIVTIPFDSDFVQIPDCCLLPRHSIYDVPVPWFHNCPCYSVSASPIQLCILSSFQMITFTESHQLKGFFFLNRLTSKLQILNCVKTSETCLFSLNSSSMDCLSSKFMRIYPRPRSDWTPFYPWHCSLWRNVPEIVTSSYPYNAPSCLRKDKEGNDSLVSKMKFHFWDYPHDPIFLCAFLKWYIVSAIAMTAKSQVFPLAFPESSFLNVAPSVKKRDHSGIVSRKIKTYTLSFQRNCKTNG
jgi:hypothetical protein